MISNERSWPHQRKPFRQPAYGQSGYGNSAYGNSAYGQPSYNSSLRPPQAPRPFVQEDKLKSAELTVERKQFFFSLKENPRGRFLRISEEASGRRNTIIIPATGLAEFQKMLEEMLAAADQVPPQAPPPEA
jgi:hypothetical protein